MIGVLRYSAAIIAVPLAIAFGGLSTELLTWTATHWPTSDVGLFLAGCIGGLIGCINLLVFGLWRTGRRANTV